VVREGKGLLIGGDGKEKHQGVDYYIQQVMPRREGKVNKRGCGGPHALGPIPDDYPGDLGGPSDGKGGASRTEKKESKANRGGLSMFI